MTDQSANPMYISSFLSSHFVACTIYSPIQYFCFYHSPLSALLLKAHASVPNFSAFCEKRNLLLSASLSLLPRFKSPDPNRRCETSPNKLLILCFQYQKEISESKKKEEKGNAKLVLTTEARVRQIGKQKKAGTNQFRLQVVRTKAPHSSTSAGWELFPFVMARCITKRIGPPVICNVLCHSLPRCLASTHVGTGMSSDALFQQFNLYSENNKQVG